MRRAIFPATFDPIHLGHCDIARRAARLFDEVVVGVYDRPLKRLLFSAEERLAMAREALKDIPNVRVEIYTGLTVDFARWVEAQAIVRGLRVFSDFELEFRMALANHRLAPEIEVVCLISGEQYMHIASSTVREIASLGGDVSSMVPPNVEKALVAHFEKLGDDAPGSVDMVSLRD
ncbi:MAG TPA: pantetheine-phosphate adenylyltransferase [Chloroflexi bacterium]|nr:pantetheine-phosphate adenylyltransferase [Chloroflexota bacterium]